MPAAGPQNTRAKQLRKRKPKLVPHGPGGQNLRPAPRRAPVPPRSPAAKQRGVRIIKHAATPHPKGPDHSAYGSDRASGGPHQMERGDKAKRTRSYYRAYHAGFDHNPKVEKAIRTLRREAKGGRSGGKAYKSAMRQLEKEQARGPDKVAEGAYRPYTARLWALVHHDYPDGKRPGFNVSRASHGQAFAWAKGNSVYYSPETLRAFEQGDKTEARRFAEGAPLHEWTHTRQRRLPRALAEGGAEAHAIDVGKKYRVHYVPVSAYRADEKSARRKGKRFLNKGQYR